MSDRAKSVEKVRARGAACTLLLTVLATSLAYGQTTRPSSRVKREPLPYDSRVSAAPAAAERVGGAVRGCTEEPNLYVCVLTPRSLGITTNSQPTLLWYLSRTTKRKYNVQIRINDPQAEKTVFDLTIPEPSEAGIQRLDLSNPPGGKQKVALEPGKRYDWLVTVLVHDAHGASNNPDASGSIEVRRAPAEVVRQVASADAYDQARAYAKAGIWYDALAALQNAIHADPADKDLKNVEADLLKKEGFVVSPDGAIAEPTPQEANRRTPAR